MLWFRVVASSKGLVRIGVHISWFYCVFGFPVWRYKRIGEILWLVASNGRRCLGLDEMVLLGTDRISYRLRLGRQSGKHQQCCLTHCTSQIVPSSYIVNVHNPYNDA